MNVMTDDDSDEEDEMMENIAMRGRAKKNIRPRTNHFETWTDEEFFVRFRLTKATALDLYNAIEGEISAPTDKNNALSAINRLLMTPRFYALGSMLIAAGDFAGVHKSTACVIVHKVTAAIAHLSPQIVRFPETAEEIDAVTNGFFSTAHFPQVAGAIDCTHVKIQSPGGDQAETFRNRKGVFSINVQTICGPNFRIFDICARWPGSAHDRTIFNNSRIRARFERGDMGKRILIGDSGYTLSRYIMMVPLRHPVTAEEQLFNESQIRTRNSAERQHGVWKRRFPVLSVGMRVRVDHVLAIIVATAVLHNMACDAGEGEPPRDPELPAVLDIEQDQVAVDPLPDNLQGDGAVRQELIQNYFRTLLR